jgi:hypothetical protein
MSQTQPLCPFLLGEEWVNMIDVVNDENLDDYCMGLKT